MKNQKNNLMYSALISFEWLFRCKDGSDRDIEEKVSIYEESKGGPIINAGTLMSFAYIALVVPQQSYMLEQLSAGDLDHSKFTLVDNLDKHNSMNEIGEFLRRIRNAISHANFEIQEKNIILFDGPPNGEVNFRVTISTEDYGCFLNSILSLWKKRANNTQ